eukprot:COSAG01_NODE_10631_length_2116_cov_5.368369_2_plen_164_part_01
MRGTACRGGGGAGQGGGREHERTSSAFSAIARLKNEIFVKRAYMSFMDTTAVKHFGMLLSYEIMIPTLYLGRAGMQLASEADRTAYLIASMQFFGEPALCTRPHTPSSTRGVPIRARGRPALSSHPRPARGPACWWWEPRLRHTGRVSSGDASPPPPPPPPPPP